MRLTIVGPPRSKKNSQQLISHGKKCGTCGKPGGRPFLIPSAAYKAWEKAACWQVRQQEPVAPSAGPTFTTPVTMRCQIYRDRAGRADLLNYLAAVSDMLQEAGVIEDDLLVASTDGSRLRIDRERPRVEIELLPFTEEIDTAPLKRRWRPRASQGALALPAPAAPDEDDVPIS